MSVTTGLQKLLYSLLCTRIEVKVIELVLLISATAYLLWSSINLGRNTSAKNAIQSEQEEKEECRVLVSLLIAIYVLIHASIIILRALESASCSGV